MINPSSLAATVVFVGLLSATACQQTFHTGKVGNTHNGPNADGTCPAGLTVCGKAGSAQCLDLDNDPQHCGTCDNACLPGIACAGGACQQVACTGPVTASTQTGSGTQPSTATGSLADINGDGRPDLVSLQALSQSNAFQVSLGQAGGGFGAPTVYPTRDLHMEIDAADSNGDGFADVYVSGQPGWVEIWQGHADGNLTLARQVEIPGGWEIAVADLNQDGRLDLVATILPGAGHTVFLADTNGDFHAGTSIPRCNGLETVLRDWNGDGFPDIVNLGVGLGVCLNRGNGSFEDELDCDGVPPTGMWAGAPEQVTAIRDFNRDGHWDLAIGRDTRVDVLLGLGGCQFQPATEYALDDSLRALTSGDVNGDGILDLVAATQDGSLTILQGGPDGTFQPGLSSPGGGSDVFSSLVVGDLTGDGKADILFVHASSGSAWNGAADVVENTCP